MHEDVGYLTGEALAAFLALAGQPADWRGHRGEVRWGSEAVRMCWWSGWINLDKVPGQDGLLSVRIDAHRDRPGRDWETKGLYPFDQVIFRPRDR